jgi:hypothetical protein
MILEILIIMTMFLWLLTILPFPPLAPYSGAGSFLCFVAVLLIVLHLFVPAIRGS